MRWFLSLGLILAACGQQKQDLVEMTEDVESKDRGVTIQITPVEKK